MRQVFVPRRLIEPTDIVIAIRREFDAFTVIGVLEKKEGDTKEYLTGKIYDCHPEENGDFLIVTEGAYPMDETEKDLLTLLFSSGLLRSFCKSSTLTVVHIIR